MVRQTVSRDPKTKPVATPIVDRRRKTSHVRPKVIDRWDDDTQRVVRPRQAPPIQQVTPSTEAVTVSGYASPLPEAKREDDDTWIDTHDINRFEHELTNVRPLPPPAPLYRTGRTKRTNPSAEDSIQTHSRAQLIAMISLSVGVLFMLAALMRTMVTAV